MKRVLFLFVIISLSIMSAYAQGIGSKIGSAAKRSAENAVVRKTEQKVDDAVSKGIDKATDPNSYKDDENDDNNNKKNNNKNDKKQSSNIENNNSGNNDEPSSSSSKNATKNDVKSVEMNYAKSDYVSGDEIFFDDDQVNEKIGEFPSMWDLSSGVAEIVSINGRKCISFTTGGTRIMPLMKDMQKYLPDVFTIDLDFYVNDLPSMPNRKIAQAFWIGFNEESNEIASLHFGWDGGGANWHYQAPGESSVRNGQAEVSFNANSWNHLSISFNKRAFKVYINGIRIANVPNMKAPHSFSIVNYSSARADTHRELISNIRVAKGAVPLYDRMMTNGKIITYGITFDVGKATIKPESMGEINRIVTLMTENTGLKFSVEGHTDNTGNASTNQTLSEERSKAVMNKLIELGIAKDRLSAAGKGQTNPISDNSTDEGRAKNRRVEFVKK